VYLSSESFYKRKWSESSDSDIDALDEIIPVHTEEVDDFELEEIKKQHAKTFGESPKRMTP